MDWKELLIVATAILLFFGTLGVGNFYDSQFKLEKLRIERNCPERMK